MRAFRAWIAIAAVLVLSSRLSAQFVYLTNGSDIILTSYAGPGGVVTISNFVVEIGSNAFLHQINLTSIVIPDNVINIESNAFQYCSSLTNASLGYGLTNVGPSAFYECFQLAEIIIPNTVTNIGSNAFQDCYSLTNVIMGNGVTNIGANAFYFCSELPSAIIPTSVANIGSNAFFECGRLTNVTIENGVGEIGAQAFALCSSLTNVLIPNTVTNIGSYAFEDCPAMSGVFFLGNAPGDDPTVFWGNTNFAYYLAGTTGWGSGFGGRPATLSPFALALNSNAVTMTGYTGSGSVVTIPNFVTSLGDGVFSGDTSLASVTIPGSVTSIGNKSFYGCSKVAGLVIPNAVATIGTNAFYSCSSLTSLTVPNSVFSLGDSAFYECGSLTNVTIGTNVAGIGNSAFYGCSRLTRVGIPNSVTNIGTNAFYLCSSLTNVIIGNEVATIGNDAFYHCSSLAVVFFDGNPPAANSTVFTSDPATAYYLPGTAGWGSNFAGLPTALFPFSCVINGTALAITGYSGAGGFVVIPNFVTSIGTNAFAGDNSLTTVIVGAGVTNIGEWAFENCVNLVTVIFNGNSPTGDSTTFAYDPYPTLTGYYLSGTTGWGPLGIPMVLFPFNYTVTGAAVTITGYTGSGGALTVPNFVGSIGSEAFINSSVTSVSIGSAMTNIGPYSFGGCGRLAAFTVDPGNLYYSSVNGVLFDKSQTTLLQYPAGAANEFYAVPNCVTGIGVDAFDSAWQLVGITIPNSVTNIGQKAFSFCPALSSINIPNSVTGSIGFATFSQCTSLSSVTIGTGITNIGDGAFQFCDNLSRLIIPANVTSISDAFFGTGLSRVCFLGNAPSADATLFFNENPTVFYLPGTTGWSNTFSGAPAVLWNPSIVTNDGNFGIRSNEFGFTVTGTTNIPNCDRGHAGFNEWNMDQRTDL